MVLWIGVDDTDSLRGMCTTFLATEFVRELTKDYDLIGYPRLVRLNPNIPWKTRGNGAICLRIGRGKGSPWPVGWVAGRAVRAYPRAVAAPEPCEIEDRIATLVERWSCFEDATTQPGFAILRRRPPPRLYWRAVRDILPKSEVLRAVNGLGIVRGYKGGRGVVGAVAAIAWRPRDRTYEILAYRRRANWGTPRWIERVSVLELDQTVPSTFNNYDYLNDRIAIAPHSPCPVLFGIRGDDPWALPHAKDLIRGEKPERWLILETNQGTDDHVIPNGKPVPGHTVRVRGHVTSYPRSLAGGHVTFRMGSIDVTAYEPSKQFRSVVRKLVPGDVVQVIGAVREIPRTINLEKILVERVTKVLRKVANPLCPMCGRRAKSAGRGAGYRCRVCGIRFPEAAAVRTILERDLQPGWYEPPVGSRRHLSKPLKRLVPQVPPEWMASGHGLAFSSGQRSQDVPPGPAVSRALGSDIAPRVDARPSRARP